MSDCPSQAVRMEARSNVSVRTKQHFAPTAIQGLEVLSLPVARLDAYVRDLVERNPLLDFDYDHGSLSFEELPDEEDGDEIVIRPMMNIQLSVDHRIIDGLLAAQFVAYLKQLLEEPIKILL